MSWRDTLKSQSVDGVSLRGKFRQARFIVPSSDATVGRRNELHEYPLRDKPYVEDLGRKARQFQVEVFVDDTIGGNYLVARDALIAALEEPGPGLLVHPWYGTMQVSLAEPASIRESTREGGRASFRISFVETGDLTFPSSNNDTAWQVNNQADNTITAISNDFVSSFDTSSLPDWTLTDLQDEVTQSLSALVTQVGDVASPIAAQIRAPANMAVAMVGAIQQIGIVATEPLRALALYQQLFSAGNDSAAVPTTTSTRKQQAKLNAALHRFIQQTAVTEAARSASQAVFPSRSEAMSAASDLQDAFDTQSEATDPVTGAPISDTAYDALDALRAASMQDLRTRGARLPDLTTYTPGITMPSLVIAYFLYADVTRADEIVARNGITHPGFVPGGVPLEVLNA